MVLTITKLKMWKDPGYTEECVEVPPVGSKLLPTPDYASAAGTTLRPRKGSTLTSIELPLSFSAVWEMSYLYMEATDSGGSFSVFGWIRGVERTASSEDAVRISWVPDYWRTFSGDMIFGRGTVTKTSDATYRRPYTTAPRYLRLKDTMDYCAIMGSAPYNFVLIKSVTLSNNITGFEYYYGTVDMVIGTQRSPTLEEISGGLIDEVLGIPASSIIGCWICPPGMDDFFNGSSVTHSYVHGGITETIVFYKASSVKKNHVENATISNTEFPGKDVKSDDMQTVITVNPYGQSESVLPWGFDLTRNVSIFADISCNGIDLYIVPNITGVPVNKHMIEGRYLRFSCLPMPVNSNAWSDYNYSGQRDYDMRSAQIQREQAAVRGIASTGQSAIGGGIAGGAVGLPGIGAIAGAAINLVGVGVEYASSGYFNDKLQDATDDLYSNQISTLLTPGGGVGFTVIGAGYPLWEIVLLSADDVSKDEYDAFVNINGYDTNIPVTDPSTFLTGGPVQIRDLQVKGEVPPAAKTGIKNKLAAGVYIIENNPTGVAP